MRPSIVDFLITMLLDFATEAKEDTAAQLAKMQIAKTFIVAVKFKYFLNINRLFFARLDFQHQNVLKPV